MTAEKTTAPLEAEARETARRWCEDQGVAPVRICGIDAGRGLLEAEGGALFHEVATNLWAPLDRRAPRAVYLGTGRHQGGLVLRPLYADFGKGWRNISTGKPAPEGMLEPADANGTCERGPHGGGAA